MQNVDTKNTRNFALIGHTADGKTSLGEAFLHAAGATHALGKVDDAPGTELTARYDADQPKRRFKLVFEIEGEAHYPGRIEAELRKALGKGKGALARAEVLETLE